MFSSPANSLRQRTRSGALAVALWLFGLSTTVLLIGLWGRSVAVDEATLEASARAVLESELVNDRMTGWIGEAVAAATDAAPDQIAAAVAEVASSEDFHRVLGDLVDQSVAAALAPPGTQVSIDVGRSVDALAPVVVEVLADEGVAVDREALLEAARVPDVVLVADGEPSGAGAARSAARVLTAVLVGGLGTLIVSGVGAVALARDRLRQVRSLAVRLAVSAFTFAIILRVGAWAVDPRGGRSPIRAGGSELLGSNGHVPLFVALVASAFVAVVTWLLLRRRTRRAVVDAGTGPADITELDDDCETGALVPA